MSSLVTSRIFLLNLVIFCCFCNSEKLTSNKGDQQLFVTPLIRAGKIERAKQLSLVQPFCGFNYTSHSAFITVDATYNSNIFFWFFLSKNDPSNDPVLLFFNGGPGTSSMFGLFGEIGPFSVDHDLNLVKREFNWVDSCNVIFADLPVGTGFSFTQSTLGYARNDDEYADQVLEFIKQFFTMFPEFSENDFYLSPESYSAKPTSIIGARIHHLTEKQSSFVKLNFKGLILLSGLIDPIEFAAGVSDSIYKFGLVNREQFKLLQNNSHQMVNYIKIGDYVNAYLYHVMILNNLTRFTGMVDFSDVRQTEKAIVFEDYKLFVQSDSFRRRVHVGNSTFHSDSQVKSALINSIFQPNKDNLEYLMNHDYRILFMNGNMDLLTTPAAQMNAIRGLNWKGADKYKEAERVVWRVNEDEAVVGYVTQVLNVVDVMVRNAGHMIPHDQPRPALDALTRFLNNQTFHS